MTVYNDAIHYSIQSAAPATGTGSAIDARIRKALYTYAFVTGGSAIMTLQASHSVGDDADWLPVASQTATDGSPSTAVYTDFYPYLRAHYSGYAGATASMVIAAGVG